MTDQQEAMREEFVEWMKKENQDIICIFSHSDGDAFDVSETLKRYEAWQAATAQTAEKIAALQIQVQWLEAVIGAMYKCFKNVPTMKDTGFDTPPEPASQWDYEAFLILAEAERILPPSPEQKG